MRCSGIVTIAGSVVGSLCIDHDSACQCWSGKKGIGLPSRQSTLRWVRALLTQIVDRNLSTCVGVTFGVRKHMHISAAERGRYLISPGLV